MASGLYRAPFYYDANALRAESRRHHIVTKRRVSGDSWEVTCSCGASTGEGQGEAAVDLWTEHLLEAIRNA